MGWKRGSYERPGYRETRRYLTMPSERDSRADGQCSEWSSGQERPVRDGQPGAADVASADGKHE